MPHNKDLTVCIKGKLIDFNSPKVMGIVNCTTDSFYEKSRWNLDSLKDADIIDIGACSTRPGSTPIDKNLEKKNLETGIKLIRNKYLRFLLLLHQIR